MSLVIDTQRAGHGCGHAGVVNTGSMRELSAPRRFMLTAASTCLTRARKLWRGRRKLAALASTDRRARTGIETVYRLRRDLALDRARAVVGAVGASFELGKGINPGTIAK